jgi:hypothetical protein
MWHFVFVLPLVRVVGTRIVLLAISVFGKFVLEFGIISFLEFECRFFAEMSKKFGERFFNYSNGCFQVMIFFWGPGQLGEWVHTLGVSIFTVAKDPFFGCLFAF